MKFRPCIDIHNGKVKQIVGGSLTDEKDHAEENFVASRNADYFASLYKEAGLKGGHVILLNSSDSPYYEETRNQALMALRSYPGGLQVGGGVNPGNAAGYIEAGASHVIVTSYVFQNGRIQYDKLKEMVESVGKEHLVLDLSCKKTLDGYFVVTDRWQKLTKEKVTLELMEKLSASCDEFLIHAVDVEGKQNGIETELVSYLSAFDLVPITYAGGVHSFEDLDLLRTYGDGKIDVTIGSALDLFGGSMAFSKVCAACD